MALQAVVEHPERAVDEVTGRTSADSEHTSLVIMALTCGDTSLA